MRGVLTPRTRAESNIAECIDASLPPPPFFLFHYPLVLLYLGRCAVATVAVCGFGSWSLVFDRGMPRQISPLPQPPLKQKCAPRSRWEKAYMRKHTSHMSRGGFYGIDQSATFESWQENFIRYRAGLGFVHGPLRRAVDKSKARSQNIKGLVLKTVVFTPSRINWALGTVPWPCPFRNRSMPAFFFFGETDSSSGLRFPFPR